MMYIYHGGNLPKGVQEKLRFCYGTYRDMPPIELYQVGDAYFVVDGNHRVSTARQEGMKTIEAYVCEFVTPVGLSAEADLDEVIINWNNTLPAQFTE